jgi:7-cyano-7-deazaguanine synthase
MSKRVRYETLALATGGLDSTTMLYQQARDQTPARVLYLDFGTPSTVREKAAVKLFAHHLGLPLDIVDLSGFAALHLGYLWPSMVSGPELDVGKPAEASFLIGRSDHRLASGFGVIVSVGLYAAMILDAPSLALAITREQLAGLPRLADGLKAATALAGSVNPDINVDIVTPLAYMSKPEVVALAVDLKVPINMTWSCALGGEKPCELCARCVARRDAIAAAGVAIHAGPPAIDPPAMPSPDIVL